MKTHEREINRAYVSTCMIWAVGEMIAHDISKNALQHIAILSRASRFKISIRRVANLLAESLVLEGGPAVVLEPCQGRQHCTRRLQVASS